MNLSLLNRILILAFLLVPSLTACGSGPATAVTPTLTLAPTETPIPLAVSINGEGISTADFEAELARYQQAQVSQGSTVTLETATQVVMNDLIDTVLLAQGATAMGLLVDDATVQGRIDNLVVQVGGLEALTTWESTHGYSDANFRSSLRREIAAAWMRDQIVTTVPNTAEQVHVKQILLYNETDAQQALNYLQTGWTFNDLAARYDPLVKGELGWFPRGYIPSITIEEAAFALQVGQYSAVLQDENGYHILYLEEYDPARLLSPDALLTLQEQAVQDWLTQKQNGSTILFAP